MSARLQRLGGLVVLWLALAASGCVSTTTTTTDSLGGRPAGQSVVPEAPDESDERRRARIRLELAANYYQQRQYNVALEELRLSLLAEPNYAPAYGLLGLVYMDLGENDKARQSFERGLAIAPADSELNNNFGWYLCRSGRERESLPYFEKATRNPLYPTPAKPWHNAGICALRMGDEVEAERFFLKSFQADPANPVAMYQLANLYLKRNDAVRARNYSQRLTTIYEPNAEALWLALRVERKLGNRENEARLAVQLRRRFPQSRETAQLLSGQYDP